MELEKKEKIKKVHDHYVHTVEVIYPLTNVKNMLKSWKKTVAECEDWINKMPEYTEEAEKVAIQAFNIALKKQEDNINKVLNMNDEEKLKYWKENFQLEVDELNRIKDNKEELINEAIKMNLKELKKYEESHKTELKNKKEAIKNWSK